MKLKHEYMYKIWGHYEASMQNKVYGPVLGKKEDIEKHFDELNWWGGSRFYPKISSQLYQISRFIRIKNTT